MNPDDSLFSHPIDQTYTPPVNTDTDSATDSQVAHPVFSDRDR